MFQVEVFWVVTPCNVAVEIKAARSSETSASYRIASTVSQPRRPRLESSPLGDPKFRFSLHSSVPPVCATKLHFWEDRVDKSEDLTCSPVIPYFTLGEQEKLI